MTEERTTAVVKRYLYELGGDSPTEPIVRALLDRSVRRLQLLCATLLYRSYPRLTQPPLNVQADELLGAVTETSDGLRMLQAIGALPEDEREAFDLMRIQGMTQVEAAELLGFSVVTVKRRLTRGLRLLEEQLADLRPEEDIPDSI